MITHYKNATVRIHAPDRTAEEFDTAVKNATFKFLKKVEEKKRKAKK